MNKDDKICLERLLKRWLLGSDTPPPLTEYPQDWQPLLNALPAEAAAPVALGLFSHYQALTQQISAATPLTPAALLPPPVLPLLPQALRPLVQQIWTQQKDYRLPLLQLLTTRGYSISPEDWQPTEIPFDGIWQLPEMYQGWQKNTAKQTPRIDADHWADFSPTEQIAAVRALRRENPEACEALLRTCLNRENAGQRLKIIEALAQENLSVRDRAFLQSLQQDRSKKLTARVNQLLAQLGCTDPGECETIRQQALALAQEFRLEKPPRVKGILGSLLGKSQEGQYQIRPRDTGAEAVARRQALWAQVSFAALAEALEISQQALLFGWDFIHNDGSELFAHRAIQTLSTAEIVAFFRLRGVSLLNHLSLAPHPQSGDSALWQALWSLWRKIPLAEQQHILAMLLQQPQSRKGVAEVILYFSAEPLSENCLSFVELSGGGVWQRLLKISQTDFARECFLLGLLLPASLAEQAVTALALARNILPYDPVFNSLNLNSKI